jgi:hypothetical protein
MQHTALQVTNYTIAHSLSSDSLNGDRLKVHPLRVDTVKVTMIAGHRAQSLNGLYAGHCYI